MNFTKIALAAFILAGSNVADAQPLLGDGIDADTRLRAQALGECFVQKSTGEDRLAVAKWMLVAMSSAPQLADVVSVNSGSKESTDRGMARLFTKLMTIDCADQARPVFASKSRGAFEIAGGYLGQIAVRELMTNPRALASMESYTKYLEQGDFEKVLPKKEK